MMVPFWPDVAKNQNFDQADNDYAKTFASLDRILVSRTATDTDNPQTTIIRGNLKEEILKLKNQTGKAISTGGVELPAELIALGFSREAGVNAGRHQDTFIWLCGASLPKKLII